MTASRLTTTVDFEADGKQTGFLRVPHSVHESAYGWIPVPIVCIKNGCGPTALLMAGNHGDEYEGQVLLMKLIRTLRQDDLTGRVIFLPAANFPAAAAGRRTSPIDNGNLNRSFPGDADGSPTSMIAHYIDSVLLPMCDYAVDLHSGGSSLMYVPCALGNLVESATERNARILELLHEFGAPLTYVAKKPMGADRAFGASAIKHNVLAIGTEAGGGGTLTPAALRIAEQGLSRILRYIGIAPKLVVEPSRGTRLVEVGGADYFVYASEQGLFEPLVELGDMVEKDQPAALIHFPHTPWLEPETVRFGTKGLVICKRVPGRAERGDCLFHLGTDRQG